MLSNTSSSPLAPRFKLTTKVVGRFPSWSFSSCQSFITFTSTVSTSFVNNTLYVVFPNETVPLIVLVESVISASPSTTGLPSVDDGYVASTLLYV